MAISHFHNFPSPATEPGLKRSEFERRNELAKFLPMWPVELADTSMRGRTKIIQRLRRAVREERKRGRAGHWTYRLGRHAALIKILAQERAALAEIERAIRCASNINGPHASEPF